MKVPVILLAYPALPRDECDATTGFLAGGTRERPFMHAFTIDAENNITVFASSKQIERTGEEIETFSSPQELAALAVKWPGARVVEIWNSLPGVEPVQRFTSREVAAARLWKAIQQLKPASGAQKRQVRSKKGGARNKAKRSARPTRQRSKTAEVIALL